MSWRTNGLAVAARNAGRTLGFNSWIASFRRGGYEARYDRNLSSAIRPGDCVWDVGANIGHYTCLFSERVGATGAVIAFEPSPLNFRRLQAAAGSLTNVRLHQIGLGRENAELHVQQGDDELGATSRVTGNLSSGVPVEICSGMTLVHSGRARSPNVIKVDVEGFEYEVLEGLGDELKATSLRVLGIEVHFGILKDLGMPDGPHKVESLLRRSGFAVSWPDSSHILAKRLS